MLCAPSFSYLDEMNTIVNKRLLAIDVMRGMTIFFMIIVNTPGSWEYVFTPLRHAPWNGCTPTDLVFPFFVFIVGVSVSFSFRNLIDTDRSVWVRKILKRTALIFLIGLFLNWFPFIGKSIGDLRVFGVLQRIALAYGLGAFIIIYVKERWLPLVFAIILLGYWAILWTTGSADPLSLEGNAVRALDLWFVGEMHIYGGYGIPFDPEGLLSSLPAAGTVLFGYFVGRRIQLAATPLLKIKKILPLGIGGIVIGVCWHFLGFPINKPLWSGSYVLYAGGLATLLLALLLWCIDEKGWKKWSYIFRVFGLNPLVSYALSGLVIKSLSYVHIGGQPFYGWIYEHFFSSAFGHLTGSFLQALVYTLCIWLFAWWLYVQGRVIKV